MIGPEFVLKSLGDPDLPPVGWSCPVLGVQAEVHFVFTAYPCGGLGTDESAPGGRTEVQGCSAGGRQVPARLGFGDVRT